MDIILRTLTPALKPGTRALVFEHAVLSPTELSECGRARKARLVREMDLQMMAVLNSKMRTKDEFILLFAAVDSRLRFNAAYQAPEDHKVCIFGAVWEPWIIY